MRCMHVHARHVGLRADADADESKRDNVLRIQANKTDDANGKHQNSRVRIASVWLLSWNFGLLGGIVCVHLSRTYIIATI